ncbi:hypothetical protein LINPERPRIM_LOCUS32007 [Linum perenne]
MHTSAAF